MIVKERISSERPHYQLDETKAQSLQTSGLIHATDSAEIHEKEIRITAVKYLYWLYCFFHGFLRAGTEPQLA